MTDLEATPSEAYQRILDAADDLFARRGYSAVTLRDIGDAVGMRHASLYYYAPGGKEQLFVDVMRRSLQRHRDGMTAVIAAAEPALRAQVHAVVCWLLEQPPMDLSRLSQADLPALSPEHEDELGALMMAAMTAPLGRALADAQERGEVDINDPELAAMALVTLMQGVQMIPAEDVPDGRAAVGEALADMLLYGWLAR